MQNQVEGRNGGGIGVYQDVGAHTGAIIGRGSSGSGPELHGEVSNGFPTILQQVSKYASIPDAKDVDLVLLDGGANDLPLTNVFNWTASTASYLEAKTREYCGDDMKYLLNIVASAKMQNFFLPGLRIS